jgi:biopolymer transport protein ExbD
MAMQVGEGGAEDDPMMEINTTPLIDVLLVLLVMLIITIPLQTHAIKLDMPQAVTLEMEPDKPTVVQLIVEADGTVLWNGETLMTDEAIETRMLDAAVAEPEPEIHLRPDRNVEYDYVARVLSAAQRNGLTKIGFVGNEQYID